MNTNEMKVLTVSGTPRERGQIIGESLHEDIHAVLAKHDDAIDRRPGYSLSDYYAAFDQYADYLGAVEKWAPGLLEEVWGLAEGANIEPQAGFRIEARSDLLANPEDDHSLNVFVDAIYRQTDRVLIRAAR
jgi:isopenicillin-N N-acyltransferase-like protein